MKMKMRQLKRKNQRTAMFFEKNKTSTFPFKSKKLDTGVWLNPKKNGVFKKPRTILLQSINFN